MHSNIRLFALARRALLVSLACAFTSLAAAQGPVSVWLTTADGLNLLKPQTPLKWTSVSTVAATEVDDTQKFQTMDGFGHALTGGSAQLLMKMSPHARAALLKELFGSGPDDIHTSYLRVTVGASDMNDHVYTYDDMPMGETDPELRHFSLAED